MKKFAIMLALFAVASGTTTHLLSAKPVSVTAKKAYALTYANGRADGDAYADDLALQYGYPSQNYTDALNAEIDRAYYNATHSEEPTYWRGYRYALMQRQ